MITATTYFIFSCVFWVNSEPIKLIDIPVNEYGMAFVDETISNFQMKADVIEEKVNSIELIHTPTGISSMSYTHSWPQNSLVIKLRTKEQEASADCVIKRILPPESGTLKK